LTILSSEGETSRPAITIGTNNGSNFCEFFKTLQ
jgi:hypothetical protein